MTVITLALFMPLMSHPINLCMHFAKLLLWLALIAGLQAITMWMVFSKIMPTFAEMGTPISGLSMAPMMLVALIVLLPVGVLLTTRPGRWGWGGHYERARQAAMSAAMVEAAAPTQARQAMDTHLDRLHGEGATMEELELITEQALSLATQAHYRTVAAVRLFGIGGLAVIAALITTNIYRGLAHMPVPF